MWARQWFHLTVHFKAMWHWITKGHGGFTGQYNKWEQVKRLECLTCGRIWKPTETKSEGQTGMGDIFAIARDMNSTRHCGCGHSWLPAHQEEIAQLRQGRDELQGQLRVLQASLKIMETTSEELHSEMRKRSKERDTWKTEALLARDVMSRVTCLTFRGTNDQLDDNIISHKNYDNFVKGNK